MKPAATPTRSRPIMLSDVQASVIATATLGRRVPPPTVRRWKHRGLVAGGHGWIDGGNLDHFLIHLNFGDTPMIASALAKSSDLVEHRGAFTMPGAGRCPYCGLGRQSVAPTATPQG